MHEGRNEMDITVTICITLQRKVIAPEIKCCVLRVLYTVGDWRRVILQGFQHDVLHSGSSWKGPGWTWNVLYFPNTTTCTRGGNYLSKIISKIKILRGRATQTASTSSFSCETNTIIKLWRRLGRQTFGFTGNKKPVEEQRRTTLSDERQSQLPTIPPPRLSGADESFCGSPFISW